MPLSEYADSIGGGLKLKGVKDGRVKKHKKKKSLKEPATEDTEAAGDVIDATEPIDEVEEDTPEVVVSSDKSKDTNRYGKTDAQLRHEERRRQMMEERISREGVKSHKEKVEELNKYLSKLSEHHDMPRIGPG